MGKWEEVGRSGRGRGVGRVREESGKREEGSGEGGIGEWGENIRPSNSPTFCGCHPQLKGFTRLPAQQCNHPHLEKHKPGIFSPLQP